MNLLIQIDTDGFGKINNEFKFYKKISIRKNYAKQDIMKELENIKYDSYSITLLEWAKTLDPSGRNLNQYIDFIVNRKKDRIYFGTLYLCLEITRLKDINY